MPATAGRVRMPANNRVHSSAALQTHGIWQSAIGYDPYAPNKDEQKQSSSSQPMSTAAGPDAENPYETFQELVALARITGSNADNETRGSCKRCGRVGHLYYQCRNFLSLKEEKEKDAAIIQVGLGSGLDKFKLNGAKELSEESSEESESSDSDFDSEMEREIAARYGRKGVSKSKTRSLSKKKDDDSDEDEKEERKKRGRSKKRTSRRRISSGTDDDEGGKKRRKEKKRRLDDSSDEDDKRRNRHRKSRKEKRRRRIHHDSDDSDSSEESKRCHKRRHRKKTSSSSKVSDSDDSQVGRAKKQSRKISKHRRQ